MLYLQAIQSKKDPKQPNENHQFNYLIQTIHPSLIMTHTTFFRKHGYLFPTPLKNVSLSINISIIIVVSFSLGKPC